MNPFKKVIATDIPIDWSLPYHKIAAQLKCSLGDVRNEWLRRTGGLDRKRFKLTPNQDKKSWQRFKKWNWKLSDSAIARSLKPPISRERVRQIRKGLGLPPSPRWKHGRKKS